MEQIPVWIPPQPASGNPAIAGVVRMLQEVVVGGNRPSAVDTSINTINTRWGEEGGPPRPVRASAGTGASARAGRGASGTGQAGARYSTTSSTNAEARASKSQSDQLPATFTAFIATLQACFVR